MKDSDDVVLDFGEEDFDKDRVLKHPIAVFFHLFFRIGSLLAYILCTWFSDSFITNFVVIVVLLSADFWTVKNISGRLLVGLRWWNVIDEEGKSQWMFESRKSRKATVTATESRIFWLSMFVSQAFWIVFLLAAILTFNFKWVMVSIVGIVMNGANTIGYLRCKWGSRQNMTSMAKKFVSAQFIKSMFSSSKPQGQVQQT